MERKQIVNLLSSDPESSILSLATRGSLTIYIRSDVKEAIFSPKEYGLVQFQYCVQVAKLVIMCYNRINYNNILLIDEVWKREGSGDI